MITTALMVRIGRVKGNKMVDMQLTNEKLVRRGTLMIANELGIDEATAKSLLFEHQSVRKAVDSYRDSKGG